MLLKSLRARLLVWIVAPLALFAALSTWVAYREAVATATVMQDRLLLGSARIIAQQIRYEDEVLQVIIPPAALELFQSDDHDRVYYRIAHPSGALLAGYTEFPPPGRAVEVEVPEYQDVVFRGTPVRMVAFAQPVFGAPIGGPLLIEVGQTLRSRNSVAFGIWLHTVIGNLLMLGLVVILIWIGIRRGTAPILRLRDQVQRRTPGTLKRLDAAGMPVELVPLVDALNDYVQRRQVQMQSHSRFIANAAHQLRTPLTLLNTQTTYALRCVDLPTKNHALRAIDVAVRQGIRLVHQLLTFSVAESSTDHAPRQTVVDLVSVVTRVLEQEAALAEAKGIDLGLEPVDDPVLVRGTPSMLHELVANLVDNALRYTPAGGMVTASLHTNVDAVELRIADNGPGIPVEERERVFERFYRLREHDCDGCGLGLSIAREIGAGCGARIALSDPPSGRGLIVTVNFPKLSPSAHGALPDELAITASSHV